MGDHGSSKIISTRLAWVFNYKNIFLKIMFKKRLLERGRLYQDQQKTVQMWERSRFSMELSGKGYFCHFSQPGQGSQEILRSQAGWLAQVSDSGLILPNKSPIEAERLKLWPMLKKRAVNTQKDSCKACRDRVGDWAPPHCWQPYWCARWRSWEMKPHSEAPE